MVSNKMVNRTTMILSKSSLKKDMFVKATHPTFGKTSNIRSLIAPQNNLLEKQNTYQ